MRTRNTSPKKKLESIQRLGGAMPAAVRPHQSATSHPRPGAARQSDLPEEELLYCRNSVGGGCDGLAEKRDKTRRSTACSGESELSTLTSTISVRNDQRAAGANVNAERLRRHSGKKFCPALSVFHRRPCPFAFGTLRIFCPVIMSKSYNRLCRHQSRGTVVDAAAALGTGCLNYPLGVWCLLTPMSWC